MAEKIYHAKDFMEKYVFTVPPTITIHELIRAFVAHNVGAIPVVAEDNTLLGIVSEGDLLYKKVRPRIPQFIDILGGTLYYCGYGRYAKSFRKMLATDHDAGRTVRHAGDGNERHHHAHGGRTSESGARRG